MTGEQSSAGGQAAAGGQARPAASALVTCDAVTYRYRPGAAAVLEGVSLCVREGRNVGIVGESGAGKSTLLSLLLGLRQPSSGTIRVAGAPIVGRTQRSLRPFRRTVQMVFQDPFSSLDPRQRVDSIVAEPLRSLRLASRAERTERVAQALASVGLAADCATRYPHEFSGGQRQRIAIARAIVSRPRLLLADEPVSALDMSTRLSVLRLLADLGRERGMTVLMVSHDLAAVAALCQDTVVMRAGRVVEQGATADVLGAPQATYTSDLIAALPRLPAPGVG